MLASLLLLAAAKAQAATLGGFVTDAENGEALPLATIAIEEVRLGAVSNSSGYYAVKDIPAGTYAVSVSYIGYDTGRDTLRFGKTGELRRDWSLVPRPLALEEEVVVEAERMELEQATQGSFLSLPVEPLQRMPAIGEADLLRSLQLLPGIQSVSDVSSGLYIRGGGPDQTAILLDHIPLYNPSHLFGFFSTFNPDAIRDVQLYKGAYPAAYGRALGSVLDVSNREGNRERASTHGGVSLISSRLLTEGPVGQGSWMLAGRRTYLDGIFSALRAGDFDIPLNYYFYDFNGKMNQRRGDDTFTASTYWGQDDLRVDFGEEEQETFFDLRWGNRALTARWTRVFSPALFGHFMAAGSSYESVILASFFDTPILFSNSIHDLSLKGDVDYFANRDHTLTLGFLATLFEFRYSQSFNQPEQSDNQPEQSELRQKPVLVSAYAQDEWQAGPLTRLRLGGRGAWFSLGNRLHFMPRLSLSRAPDRGPPGQGGRGDVPPVPAAGHHRNLQRRRFLGTARQQRRAGSLLAGCARHRVEPVAPIPAFPGGLLHRPGKPRGARQRRGRGQRRDAIGRRVQKRRQRLGRGGRALPAAANRGSHRLGGLYPRLDAAGPSRS